MFAKANEITTLTPVARYHLMSFLFKYLGLNINGCDNLVKKPQCPLKPNDVGTFKLSFPVPNVHINSISIWIEFSLIGQNEKVHSCFQVNFLVKKGD
ncbi:hypothetical protein KQX54_021539 [Cotesia glomerata]|uniref:MD-2-related lipid-recognition domain-containing protein n=1 Tax=Cotesia glomerata TaxID=32391 RepID=A0AAV7J9Q8_COTGL|nr:hypothetical protein KQX54_021539 [Cotesia glomerata]